VDFFFLELLTSRFAEFPGSESEFEATNTGKHPENGKDPDNIQKDATKKGG